MGMGMGAWASAWVCMQWWGKKKKKKGPEAKQAKKKKRTLEERGAGWLQMGKVNPPLFTGVFHTLCKVLYGGLAVGAVGTAGGRPADCNPTGHRSKSIFFVMDHSHQSHLFLLAPFVGFP